MGGHDKAEKITIMVLKVDLQCSSCYKKVKKVICKVPQIRDQVYDEKANTVTITVVCCSPERIREKLCCKGGGVIKSIEIKDTPKPKEPEKPKQPEKPKVVTFEKPKEPEKPKVVTFEKPKEPEKPKAPEKPKEPEKPEKPKEQKPKDGDKPKPKEVEKPKDGEKPKPKEPEKPKEAPKPQQPQATMVMSMQGYPMAPVGYSCGQCYESYGGGPCYHCYGTPVQPAQYYNNYSYGPVSGPTYGYVPEPSYGPGHSAYGKGYYVNNNSEYFSEENASGCSIM